MFNGLPIYLLSTNSTINGYKTVSTAKPTNPTIQYIEVNNTGLIGQWISNAYSLPQPRTIERKYNFVFRMYANTTAQTRMYAEFYIYRNNQEIYLFTTSESEEIKIPNAVSYIWQYETQQQITFNSGDRIALKMYFNSTTGTHKFFYSCLKYPSYFTDPTETRYLRKSTIVLNGTTYKQLKTTFGDTIYGSTGQTSGKVVQNCSIGIRVYNRTQSGTEQEITSGLPVALVNRTVNSGYTAQFNTWSCPNANWNQTANCSLLVRYFATFDNNGTWFFLLLAITEGLGSNFLNASTWTVTYYTKYALDGSTSASCSLAYDGLDDASDYYPTRISNIVYNTADYQAPYYYNIVYETTLVSTSNTIYCNWTEIGTVKSTLSYYRYGHNNTGSFTWFNWLPFVPSSQTQNVSCVLTNNNTVGNVVSFMFQANDTSGNLNDTMPYQYFTITSAISWHQIAQLYVILKTRQWTQINQLYVILKTRQWTQISQLWTLLRVRGWTQISQLWVILQVGYSQEQVEAYFLIGATLASFICFLLYFAFRRKRK